MILLLVAALAWIASTGRDETTPATRTPASAPVPAPPSAPAPAQADASPDAAYYRIRGEDVAGGRRFHVRNTLHGPIGLEVRFDAVDNMRSEPRMPFLVTIAARTEAAVVDVLQVDPQRGASFTLGWTAFPGSPGARHSDAAHYRVPLAPSSQWTLDQGFGGEFSHQFPESRHALDFGVAVGTGVVAARDGVVMQVEDRYRGGGLDFARFGTRANEIRVLHADGTMGVYVHLDTGSAVVVPGDRVAAGTPIARSGATGYVSGPHLHFAVQVNTGRRLESVPFDMDGVDERARPALR